MLRARPATTVANLVAEDLYQSGYSVVSDAIDGELALELAREAKTLWDADQYRAARIGSGDNLHLAPEIRSDRVLWIDETLPTLAQAEYLEFLDTVRVAINRRTYLGLYEWEGHLAVYPPGSRYRQHLDVFANARARQISTILYLNDAWQPGDGGELRIWTDPALPQGPFVDIEPRFGTLVSFLSEDYFHEVLPTRIERFSVTGWFRVRP